MGKNTENDEKSENPEIKGSYWQRRGIELKMRYKNGEISRLEYIKLSRADKKQRKANRREKLGLPKIVPKFDMNNEKIWFRNTYRQTKCHLVTKMVRRMRAFRFSLEKLKN